MVHALGHHQQVLLLWHLLAQGLQVIRDMRGGAKVHRALHAQQLELRTLGQRARRAVQHPDLEWVTLEDRRARAVISELSRCVAGQPLPVVKIAGLPEAVQGVWSLWEISLSAEGLNRKRFLPVFATDDGRTFVPTAKRIWDLLLTEAVEITGATTTEQAVKSFEASVTAAKAQGERLFSEL